MKEKFNLSLRMGKYVVYALEGCPYSDGAIKLFEKISNCDIIKVSQSEKENFKNNSKHPMKTFPQIYYYPKIRNIAKNNKIFEVIGGLNDINRYIENKDMKIKSYKTSPNDYILGIIRKSINRRFSTEDTR